MARVGVEQQMIYKSAEQIHHAGAPRDTVLIKMSPAEGKTSAKVLLFKHKMSEMPAGSLSSGGLGL